MRIGSVVIPSSAFTSWSSSRIRFRIPVNTPPGNLTVRTSQGTSNAIRLQITSPYLTRISPTRIETGNRLTLTGGNFGDRRSTGYVLFISNVRPSAADYMSWSNSRIVVKVPARARSGNVQVTTSNGTSGTKLLQIESRSPQISSVSPRRVQYNQVVTVTGSNFGSSRGSSTVRIGSVVIPSSSLASWSNTRIRFRVPTNMRSGNVTVRTSTGTSNAIRLEITSPYLASVSPSRVKPGDRLTLTGANFGSRRGSGYVLFAPNARPLASSDYVVWSGSRIVVKVPARARSGDVKVVTGAGTSGGKRIVVESVAPQITSVSPRQVLYNQVVTVTGINFGSSRGSSTVRIGSVVIPSSWLDSWSNTIIRFRVPTNMRSGNLVVRTSKGTSNAILLEIISPYLGSVSPSRVKPGDRLTLTGANFRSSRGSSYVLFAPNVRPLSGDYVTWNDSRIVVRVPAGAQSGDVKVAVIGAGVSGTKRVVVESASSPQITSVSPRQVQYNQVVTVIGSSFGSSRGSSSVRIGSVAISSFTTWSSTIIRFRVPTNVRSGNLTVRTSAGTSNAIRLEITSPYLGSVSPVSVKPGDRLTLTGANFGSSRGSGYVLFAPNVRPSSGDYVTWSDSRIVVKVPVGAQSGDVKVVATGSQSSGTKRIIVEGEVVESLPSRGLFGYSPPAVTKNPKSVKFGFGATNTDIACYFSVKEISDGEVTILLNERSYSSIPESEDWTSWYLVLDRSYLRSGTNIIEFRNIFNQNRTSSFAHWQLKDVWVGEPPPSAKPVAGAQLLSKLPDGLVSGLGDPFPTPFNAEVTIPFVLAEAGPVRLTLYNLMGQQIRVLADEWVAAGAHSMRWDGRTAVGTEAASGVYWAVLQAGGAVQTAKLALIR